MLILVVTQVFENGTNGNVNIDIRMHTNTPPRNNTHGTANTNMKINAPATTNTQIHMTSNIKTKMNTNTLADTNMHNSSNTRAIPKKIHTNTSVDINTCMYTWHIILNCVVGWKKEAS